MYQAQKKDYERDMIAKKITPEKPNNNLAGLTHRSAAVAHLVNGTS